MYIPAHFEQPGTAVMHELIRVYPLATAVTLLSSGLNANHIPLHLSADASKFGLLTGHVARANSIWHEEGDMLEQRQPVMRRLSPNLC